MKKRLAKLAALTVLLLFCSSGISASSEPSPLLSDSCWSTETSDSFWSTATVEEVEEELRSGPDLSTQNSENLTALHCAVLHTNDEKIISVLLNAGADPNAKDHMGTTPLHSAATDGNKLGVAEALIEAGADVHSRNSFDSIPLHHAAMLGSPELMSLLLKAGADVNVQGLGGLTPLDLALFDRKEGHSKKGSMLSKKVSVLIEAGADVNGTDSGNLPPLIAALIHSPSMESVSMLIAAGADVGTVSSGRGALHVLTNVLVPPDRLSFLIEAGADVNQVDTDGFTPIQHAAMRGDERHARVLAEAGADVNARMQDGTALHAAVLRGSRHLIPDEHLLIRAERRSVGTVELNEKYQDVLSLVSALVESGADVDAYSSCGLTPLHLASNSERNPKLLDWLLRNGADPCRADCGGELPLDHARRNEEIFGTASYDRLSLRTQECPSVTEAANIPFVRDNSCQCDGWLGERLLKGLRQR